MEPGGQNSATVPYIGSKISLISNVDIRYEGILYSINTFESTVALQNVRSFGTEGRRNPEIPPSNKTYQFIIFKGKDIKDLTVCEPATARIPEDPAVVSVNVPPSTPPSSMMPHGPQSQMQTPPMGQSMGQGGDVGGQSAYGNSRMYYGVGGAGGAGGRGGSFPQGGQGRMPGYPMQQPQGAVPGSMMPMIRSSQGGPGSFGFGAGRGAEMYQPRQRAMFGGMVSGEVDNMCAVATRGGRFGGGRGGMRGRGGSSRIVGELPPQPNQAMKKQVSKAFDFESANAKFDKSEAKIDAAASKAADSTEASASGTPEKQPRSGYDKAASFFDHISCETLDRAAGQDSRVDREKQRLLDYETFGHAAATSRGRSYRRGYRRGGGGPRRGGPGGGTGFGGYSRNAAPRYVPVNYMQGAGVAGYGGMMPRF